MSLPSLFSRLFLHSIPRGVAVAVIGLSALLGGNSAFCGEIHTAAQKGDLAKVKALLKDNPDLVFSKDNQFGVTPLHVAAAQGYKDLAEFLLTANADVNAKANNGWTPLHFAAAKGSKDAAQLLLAHGADVNAKANKGEAPLHVAAFNGHREVAELFLASQADINAKENLGWTPLHYAAKNGFRDVTELLLAHGADVHAKANKGETPLDAAVANGHQDVAELLRQHDSQLILPTSSQTPAREPPSPTAQPSGDGQTDRVSQLLDELKDKDLVVRESAALGLRKIKDPRAVEPFIVALKDTDSEVRQVAAQALGEIKAPRAVEPLIATLNDTDSGVRLRVAWALGEIKAPRAVEPLIATLYDTDSGVRLRVAWALGEIKDPRAVERLIAALNDASPYVRNAAAAALGKINDPLVVDPLIAALKDPDSTVSRTAAKALGRINDPRAVEALSATRNDTVSHVRQGAPTIGVGPLKFAAIDQIVILPVVDSRDVNNGKGNLQFMLKFTQKVLTGKHYAAIQTDNKGKVGEIVEGDLNRANPEWIRRLGPPEARWVMVIGLKGQPSLTGAEVFGFLYDKESGIVLWNGRGLGGPQFVTPTDSSLQAVNSAGMANLFLTISGMARKEVVESALENLLSGIPQLPKKKKTK